MDRSIWRNALLFVARSVYKIRPQSGEKERLSSANIFWIKRELFRCGRPHFLVLKNLAFFEIYGLSVRTRERGWTNADVLRTRGRGEVNFLRFCADVFYGQPLMNQQQRIKGRVQRFSMQIVMNSCFLLNPEKNLVQICHVVFKKNAKNAPDVT